MSRRTRIILAAALDLLGLGLIIGGILADKGGAVVIGLSTAAVATVLLVVIGLQARQGEK